MNEKNEKKNKGWLVVLVLLLIAGLAVGGYFYFRDRKPVDTSDPKADAVKVLESFAKALEKADTEKVEALLLDDSGLKAAISSLPEELKSYINAKSLNIKVKTSDLEEVSEGKYKAGLEISFTDFSEAIKDAKEAFVNRLSEIEEDNKVKEEALAKEGLSKEEKDKLEKPQYLSAKDKEKLFNSFLKDSLNACKDTKASTIEVVIKDGKITSISGLAEVLTGNSLVESTKVLSEVKALFKDDENYGEYSEVEDPDNKEDNKEEKDPNQGNTSGTGNNTNPNQGNTSGGNNTSGNGSTGGNTTPSNPGGNTGGSTSGNSGGNTGSGSGNTTPSNPNPPQPEEPKYPYHIVPWGTTQAYQCDLCGRGCKDIAALNAHTCTPCQHEWEDVKEKVRHDEVGHYENRCTQEAWDEPVRAERAVCKVCGEAFIRDTECADHILITHGGKGSWTITSVVIDYIHHDAVYENVYVVDTPAYDEWVVVGQRCKICGKDQ